MDLKLRKGIELAKLGLHGVSLGRNVFFWKRRFLGTRKKSAQKRQKTDEKRQNRQIQSAERKKERCKAFGKAKFLGRMMLVLQKRYF